MGLWRVQLGLLRNKFDPIHLSSKAELSALKVPPSVSLPVVESLVWEDMHIHTACTFGFWAHVLKHGIPSCISKGAGNRSSDVCQRGQGEAKRWMSLRSSHSDGGIKFWLLFLPHPLRRKFHVVEKKEKNKIIFSHGVWAGHALSGLPLRWAALLGRCWLDYLYDREPGTWCISVIPWDLLNNGLSEERGKDNGQTKTKREIHKSWLLWNSHYPNTFSSSHEADQNKQLQILGQRCSLLNT